MKAKVRKSCFLLRFAHKFLLLMCLTQLLSSCGQWSSWVSPETSPYEKYLHSLEEAKLANNVMVKKWIAAGEKVFTDSLRVSLPYKEKGYFNAASPSAAGLLLSLERGQHLTIKVQLHAKDSVKLFADLFFLRSKDDRERLAFAEDSLSIEHEPEETGSYLLRLQPELLASCNYTLTIRAGRCSPSLSPAKTARP